MPARRPRPAGPRRRPRSASGPNGDTEIQPDMSQITSEELKKVFAYIDEHVDEHVENLQKWIQQPSISNTGEGIPESAEMVKGFFDQLGCQESRVYDVGTTEWGAQGNPVVYARCDEGAAKTLVDLLDVRHDAGDPAGRVDRAAVRRAAGRAGAVQEGADRPRRDQLQGPQMAQWNALMAIKAVTGKLPVNLIFVAEGDEERMSIGYRKFVKDHPELFKGADAMYRFGGQGSSGGGELSGGSEGCVYVELTTSGAKWGRGPTHVRHPRRQQAQRRQPGLASHPDADDAGLRRRQQGADRRLLREHRAAVARTRLAKLEAGGQGST